MSPPQWIQIGNLLAVALVEGMPAEFGMEQRGKSRNIRREKGKG
jgi:hypothetical protein